MYSHVRRPFLLRVSFLAPHTPILTPEPFYSLYDPAGMDRDVPTEEVLNSRRIMKSAFVVPLPIAHTPMRNSGACDAAITVSLRIDQQVGKLVDCLRETGQLDHTLIVYTSDHGDLLGEYGQFQKGMFYELTTRVPCIMAGPGIPAGQRATKRPTECVDIAPTLLQAAGLNTA